MHHYKKYKKTLNIDYYFYGDITNKEEKTLSKLVKANSENLHSNNRIAFITNWEEYYV